MTLSQYTKKNNSELWNNLKRILRYLKGTTNLKLVYKQVENCEPMTAFVDANFASSEAETSDGIPVSKLKTSSGFIINLFEDSVIYQNTKRQNLTPRSTTEAEYLAIRESLQEILWLKELLSSIGIKVDKPIVIHEEKNSALTVNNFMATNKYIQIPCDRIKDRTKSDQVVLEYISTEDQIADIFTKSLPRVSFQKLCGKLGLNS